MNETFSNFLAHKNNIEEEKLINHLTKVASTCVNFSKPFHQTQIAKIIGLLHDLGKYSLEFQKRIRGSNKQVDHSTAGAQFAKEFYKFEGDIVFQLLIAFCIMGHHAGIPNRGTKNDTYEEVTLEGRFKKDIPAYKFFAEELKDQDLIFDKKEITDFILKNRSHPDFSYSFLIRMLFSCLVDADFLETEKFFEPKNNRKISFNFEEMEKSLNTKINTFNELTGKINESRKDILNNCYEKAENEQGIFTLTVPTGGGKTISSMAFAIKHLLKHKLKRIIYVIPYSSIIEQNALIFKEIFGTKKVIEHHYSYEFNTDENYQLTRKEQKIKWATENWDAPIIVTTNVQFFESLFSNKPSKCRKLHNITNSIIIFDEVQMFPYDYLKPALLGIKELVMNYGCSVVLSSATQPNFSPYLNNLKIKEIVDNPTDLNVIFKRVKIIKSGEYSNQELTEIMSKEKQILTIVNERKMAFSIFKALKNKQKSFCLTTLLTPFDRKKNIKKIKRYLKKGENCRVVSTQLIEAGVDIDFPLVYRAMTGMDSIIQSAGRCNREGKYKEGKVILFNPKEKTKRKEFNFIDQAEKLSEIVFSKFSDVLSLEAIKYYFEYSYDISNLDKNDIIKMFVSGDKNQLLMNYQFREAAEKFKLINNFQRQIIIRNKLSEKVISKLKVSESIYGLLRELQQHSVSVYQYEFEKLKSDNKISEIMPNIFALDDFTIYNEKTGLDVFYENEMKLLNG